MLNVDWESAVTANAAARRIVLCIVGWGDVLLEDEYWRI